MKKKRNIFYGIYLIFWKIKYSLLFVFFFKKIVFLLQYQPLSMKDTFLWMGDCSAFLGWFPHV